MFASNFTISAMIGSIECAIPANLCSKMAGKSAYIEPSSKSAFVESLNKEISQCQTIQTQTSTAAKGSRGADCLSGALSSCLQSLACHSLVQVLSPLGRLKAQFKQLQCLSTKDWTTKTPNHHSETALDGRHSAPVFCMSFIRAFTHIQIGAAPC